MKKIPLVFTVLLVLLLVSCEWLFHPTENYTGAGIVIINYGPNSSNAFVGDEGKVVAVVSVVLNGFAHDNADDVKISLRAPDGTTVTLVDSIGTNSNLYVDVAPHYTFVDDNDSSGLSHIVIFDNDVVVPETYQSEGDFDDFDDVDIYGDWELIIYDNEDNVSVSSLTSWTLKIKYNPLL
jgi:subtilisin-like proprotein convertase family protein